MSITPYIAPTREQLTALVNQRNKLQELVTFALNNLDAKSWSGLMLDTSDLTASELHEEHWIEMFCRELNGIGYKVDPRAFHALRNRPRNPRRAAMRAAHSPSQPSPAQPATAKQEGE